MAEGKSRLGLYIALIALLLSVANIFLSVLPTIELRAKIEVLNKTMTALNKLAQENKRRIKRLHSKKSKGLGQGATGLIRPPALKRSVTKSASAKAPGKVFQKHMKRTKTPNQG